MPPSPEEASRPVYLPPLDRLFTGETRIISWRTAFEALSDPHLSKHSPGLEAFLADEVAIETLSHPFAPFPPPNSQTKSEFETRTAAINVTPTSNGSYDINKIKEDASWLSEQTKINEVAALRVVVLEWQEKPVAQLLEGYTEEENISLQAIAGSAAYVASGASPDVSVNGGNTFDSDDRRRVRLLQLLLRERESVLAVRVVLQANLALGQPRPPPERSYGPEALQPPQELWLSETKKKIFDTAGHEPRHDSIESAVDALRQCLVAIDAGSGWSVSPEAVDAIELLYLHGKFLEVLRILQVIFMQLCEAQVLPTGVVKAWFEFVGNHGFFAQLQPPSPAQNELIESIQLLVSIISLQVLKLPETLHALLTLSPSASSTSLYALDVSCQTQISHALFGAADHGVSIASFAIFAWSSILQTIRVEANASGPETASDDETLSDSRSTAVAKTSSAAAPKGFIEAVENVMSMRQDEDPIVYLAKTAMDAFGMFAMAATISNSLSNVFDSSQKCLPELHARVVLLEMLRCGLTMTSYSSDAVDSILVLLSQDSANTQQPNFEHIRTDQLLLNVVINDQDVLVPGLLEQSSARYPYETPPFLRFSKVLCETFASEEVDNILIPANVSRFTHLLPTHFGGYDLIREDENANSIRLTEDLPMFIDRKLKQSATYSSSLRNISSLRDDTSQSFIIPRGTIGYVISDSKPFVVSWEFEHSPLRYLGILLSTAPASSNLVDITDKDIPDDEIQADIIDLLSALISASLRPRSNKGVKGGRAAAKKILDDASVGLAQNVDIITVVHNIFEEELSRQPQQRIGTGYNVLVSCIDFFREALAVRPVRIWPIIARSALLELDGQGGRIRNIIASSEVPFARFDFLLACIHLFRAFMEDAVTNVVSRKSPGTTLTTLNDTPDDSTGVPQKTMSAVLLSFTRISLDVLQSAFDWNFASKQQQFELAPTIIRTLDATLIYVYNFDDSQEPSGKLTSILAPAAQHLVDTFLAKDSNTFIIRPLLLACMSGMSTLNAALFSPSVQAIRKQTSTALDFIIQLLRLSVHLKITSPQLDAQVFHMLPVLARIYVSEQTYRVSIVSLLSTLMRSAGRSEQQPPSLFGNLGLTSAKNFMTILFEMSKPLNNPKLDVEIWNLMTDVVSGRQQWFATFLLTGDTPRETLKRKDERSPHILRTRPMLDTVLEKIPRTQPLHSQQAVAMLRFLVLAQNYWPWITSNVRNHQQMLTVLSNYIAEFHINVGFNQKMKDMTEQCVKVEALSLVVEFFAMYLHNARHLGDVSFLQTLTGKIRVGQLEHLAVAVPNYNSSLHQKLKVNFDNKFSGCTLPNFKRAIGPRPFGDEYYYDVAYAAKVLGLSQGWNAANEHGIVHELRRANCNLSLVEAQLLLANSWKSLAIEISNSLAGDQTIQKQMGYVVHKCLYANRNSNFTENIFVNLASIRTDLALVILQRLVNVKSQVSNMRTMLQLAWDVVRDSGQDFETAFVGPTTPYYRSLLRILLLVLHAQTHDEAVEATSNTDQTVNRPTDISSSELATVLEIVTSVIAKGFRSLCSQLHEDPSSVLPADFALLTALFQTILRIPGMEAHHSQLAIHVTSTNVHRYAIALFSWSDRLNPSPTDIDPIYGELSILFLAALSNISHIAETFATEGLLAQLSAATICDYFRRQRGSGPFDSPQRLFTIWTRGILPLTLNLLTAVGEPFAPETAAFLNGFTPQLARASSALDPKAIPSLQNPTAGSLTLDLAAEAHNLALIGVVLDAYGNSPAAVAVGEIQELKWERTQVREDADAWVGGSRAAVRERVVPMTAREVELAKQGAASGKAGGKGDVETRLEELVLSELRGVVKVVGVVGSGSR